MSRINNRREEVHEAGGGEGEGGGGKNLASA